MPHYRPVNSQTFSELIMDANHNYVVTLEEIDHLRRYMYTRLLTRYIEYKKEKAKERSMREQMDKEMKEKDDQLQELLHKHQQLEERLSLLNLSETETKQDNDRLLNERSELERMLLNTQDNLKDSQTYIDNLKQQQKEENRERARSALRVTEGIVMERESLIRQLDSLREMNRKLRDDQDIAVASQFQTLRYCPCMNTRLSPEPEDHDPLPKKLQKQGSVLSNYVPSRKLSSRQSQDTGFGPSWNENFREDTYDEEGDMFSSTTRPSNQEEMFHQLNNNSLCDDEDDLDGIECDDSLIMSNLSATASGQPLTSAQYGHPVLYQALTTVQDDQWASAQPLTSEQYDSLRNGVGVVDIQLSQADINRNVSDEHFNNVRHDVNRNNFSGNATICLDNQLENRIDVVDNSYRNEGEKRSSVKYSITSDTHDADGEVEDSLPVQSLPGATFTRNSSRQKSRGDKFGGLDSVTSSDAEGFLPSARRRKPRKKNISAKSNDQYGRDGLVDGHGRDLDDSTAFSIGRHQPLGSSLNNSEEALSLSEIVKETVIPQTPQRLFKVVFIGDSGVGKSSFIYRFCNNEFKASFSATIGVDFQVKSVTVDEEVVALQLWDTAGQERFRSITKQYFRKADGVIIMYSLTCEQSFKNIRNWMTSVAEGIEDDTTIIIVGNKLDLIEESTNRAVTSKAARSLAEEYKGQLWETSAKSGHNVDEIMETLASLLKEKEDRQMEDAVKLDSEVTKRKSGCCKKN